MPLRPKEEANYCLCEQREAISREGGGLQSIFSVLFQGDCRGTSCLAMTTNRAMVRWDISLALKYDVRGMGRISLASDKSVRAGDAFFVKKFKNLCKYRVIALKKVDGKYKIC